MDFSCYHKCVIISHCLDLQFPNSIQCGASFFHLIACQDRIFSFAHCYCLLIFHLNDFFSFYWFLIFFFFFLVFPFLASWIIYSFGSYFICLMVEYILISSRFIVRLWLRSEQAWWRRAREVRMDVLDRDTGGNP